MWTDIARQEHKRTNARYPSDMSDAEWAVIAPFVPPAKFGGRPREVVMREIINAIFYQASSGCQWRMLPKEFPAYSTVQNYFYPWRDDGTLALMNFALVQAARELETRNRVQVPVLSTARALKPPKVVGFAGTTQARRSKAASATS